MGYGASMSAPRDPDAEAARDLGRGAAIRDVVAGATLLGIGVVSGGASWLGDADGVDVAFDVLGVAWIAWGLGRLIVGRRRGPTSQARPDRRPDPRS